MLVLKVETKSKLPSADTVPGTAGDALCRSVGVDACVRMRVHVTVPWSMCTTARLHVHVIPLNDLFSKQRESPKE